MASAHLVDVTFHLMVYACVFHLVDVFIASSPAIEPLEVA